MLCEKCHKNVASTNYSEVVEGVVRKLKLCCDCLTQKKEHEAGCFELSEPVSQPRLRTSLRDLLHEDLPQKSCESCGTKLSDALQTGKLGCVQCYTVFSAQIVPLLRQIHGGTVHRGKSPDFDDARAGLHTQIQSKRALLRKSLKLERYEEAAVLRDNIKSLESELATI